MRKEPMPEEIRRLILAANKGDSRAIRALEVIYKHRRQVRKSEKRRKAKRQAG